MEETISACEHAGPAGSCRDGAALDHWCRSCLLAEVVELRAGIRTHHHIGRHDAGAHDARLWKLVEHGS